MRTPGKREGGTTNRFEATQLVKSVVSWYCREW